MNDVDIFIYYPYLDGTTTSLIDMYFNLKKFMNVKCTILINTNNEHIKDNITYVKTLNKSIPTNLMTINYININELSLFQKNNKFKNLIISFGIFRFLNLLEFNYDNLIILDAGRIVYDYYNNNCINIDFVKSLKNTIILGNKFNSKFLNCRNYYIWYHKFSKERFSKLKYINKKQAEGILLSENRSKKGNLDFKYLNKSKLIYNRWRKINDSIFTENIGKIIFEFSALNKNVLYDVKNKTQDDGLTEYLSLFNIDDNIKQQIMINENELFYKLGFYKDDKILGFIK